MNHCDSKGPHCQTPSTFLRRQGAMWCCPDCERVYVLKLWCDWGGCYKVWSLRERAK